jgi:hypothetical protein
MPLTDSQKETVSDWITQGKSLAEVQRLLRKEFSVSMTYMDVRFLVDDLNIAPSETQADEAAETAETAETDEKVEEPELVEEGVSHSVSVEVDAISPPGALMSGNATFSDGATLGWQLMSNGQLGLIPGDTPDYRPSPEDMQDFRVQMDGILHKKGFGV